MRYFGLFTYSALAFTATAASSRLAVGDMATCFKQINGDLYCFGSNESGQLGFAPQNDMYTPTLIAHNTKNVCVGTATICIVSSLTGAVTCQGNNEFGQLGDEGASGPLSSTMVQPIGLESGVDAVECGSVHVCAVLSSGGARCWGAGEYGQLGNQANASASTPQEVFGFSSQDVAQLSTGSFHTCLVTTTGAAQCTGYNEFGQLGDETTDNRMEMVQVSGLDSDVVMVSAGGLHTCALLGSGQVYCWGVELLGQLGNTEVESMFRTAPVLADQLGSDVAVSITCGSAFTCVVREVGRTAACFGSNENGQFALGVEAGEPEMANHLLEFGELVSGIQEIRAGLEHVCILLESGAVQCAGLNDRGQLGNGQDLENSVILTDIALEYQTFTPTVASPSSPTTTPKPTSLAPTRRPTTRVPTHEPTTTPSHEPTHEPTKAPSFAPTFAPTKTPTFAPTFAPTLAPTHEPTKAPTFAPTFAPTKAPTFAPTFAPTLLPTHEPTKTPTFAPSLPPTKAPTREPTKAPTLLPTREPTTLRPTLLPIVSPSASPTAPTTMEPTTQTPSVAPTVTSMAIYTGSALFLQTAWPLLLLLI